MINTDLEKNFKRLKYEQDNYLKSCNEKIENWEKFQNDYFRIKERLKTLPNNLDYEIMVPISKVAFMPGKLVHTNEILVLLGDNWFTERSAHQACEIIDRRLSGIKKQLEDLHKEKNSLLDQMQWSSNIFQNNGEFVNIEEKLEDEKPDLKKPKSNLLSEEEKKELRRKQQEKALKIQASIDESLSKNDRLSKRDSESEDDQHDEEDFKRVKEIKKQIDQPDATKIKPKTTETNKPVNQQKSSNKEQPKLTFEEMLKEYEKTIDRENNNLLQNAFEKIEISSENNSKKVVKWFDDVAENIDEQDDYDDQENQHDNEEEEEDDDYDENDPINKDRATNVIKITHTKGEEINELLKNRIVSRDKPEIDNPGDIYKVFYKPKSILKQSSFTSFDEESVVQVNSKENHEQNVKPLKCDSSKAFTGEIVEREFSSMSTKTANSSRPVSKFKANKTTK